MKPKPKPKQKPAKQPKREVFEIRPLARKITNRIFTGHCGKADRLQLMHGNYLIEEELDGGGWCWGAVFDIVNDELKRALKKVRG